MAAFHKHDIIQLKYDYHQPKEILGLDEKHMYYYDTEMLHNVEHPSLPPLTKP